MDGRVSIHAPARGATVYIKGLSADQRLFQSTLPRGERPPHDQPFVGLDECFNPRSREGSDLRRGFVRVRQARFQSTLPRGERPEDEDSPANGVRCFNPRSREGSDRQGQQRVDRGDRVSIHAPARGATRSLRLRNVPQDVSIHAPARGATYLTDFTDVYGFVSIHAPARGATGLPGLF